VPFPRFVNWSFRRGSKSAQLIAERPIPPKIPILRSEYTRTRAVA
jgi:hypothetical protein